MTKEEIEIEMRNPQINFENVPNLAVQTGNKSIQETIADFERAGRAIMVANADENFPEVDGLPYAPDPLEAEILRREIDGEMLVARKRLAEDQERAMENSRAMAAKNEEELQRLRIYEKEMKEKQPVI